MRYGRAAGALAMGALFAVGVVAASAVNNVATATVTTEYHTYTDTVTVSAKGREVLFTVEGTITDLDTIPDPVTVTTSPPTTTAPALPVAAFTMTPAAPWVGVPVTFNASISSCPDQPCTYLWVDDGPDGPGDTQWPLCGNVAQCVFTFTGGGTIRARLNLTDASGDVSTVMRQFTLLAAPPVTTTTTTTAPTTTAPPPTTGAGVANIWVSPS